MTAPTALGILGHELVHGFDNCENGHGKEFKKVALAIGLEGKMRSAFPGPALSRINESWLDQLGVFPYAPLMGDNGRKKAATRLIKCECKACEYIVRAARKPIEELGAPICPGCNEQMTVAGADRDESEGE